MIKIRNFLLLILLVFLLGGLFYRLFEDYKRHQLLKKDFLELVKKEQQLKEEIKNLEMIKSESNLLERLEKQARLMLGFKKEGEEVILVVPPKENQISPLTSTSTKETTKSSGLLENLKNLWYNILKVLKG
ncbi:MAG: septum formation initiator family protein [Minisyncoccia bacterium]